MRDAAMLKEKVVSERFIFPMLVNGEHAIKVSRRENLFAAGIVSLFPEDPRKNQHTNRQPGARLRSPMSQKLKWLANEPIPGEQQKQRPESDPKTKEIAGRNILIMPAQQPLASVSAAEGNKAKDTRHPDPFIGNKGSQQISELSRAGSCFWDRAITHAHCKK